MDLGDLLLRALPETKSTGSLDTLTYEGQSSENLKKKVKRRKRSFASLKVRDARPGEATKLKDP